MNRQSKRASRPCFDNSCHWIERSFLAIVRSDTILLCGLTSLDLGTAIKMTETVLLIVQIDDGTPRIPLSFRLPLSTTVLRLKEMVEEQEGFTVSEQDFFLGEVQLCDSRTLGQLNLSSGASLHLRVNFQEIPSPTRKTSMSVFEDCVVPDIDDDDNVFNFDQPKVSQNPQEWTVTEVLEWLQWMVHLYNLKGIDIDKFKMNGKGLYMMGVEGFMYRVPSGGEILYNDFQRRLSIAAHLSQIAALKRTPAPLNLSATRSVYPPGDSASPSYNSSTSNSPLYSPAHSSPAFCHNRPSSAGYNSPCPIQPSYSGASPSPSGYPPTGPNNGYYFFSFN